MDMSIVSIVYNGHVYCMYNGHVYCVYCMDNGHVYCVYCVQCTRLEIFTIGHMYTCTIDVQWTCLLCLLYVQWTCLFCTMYTIGHFYNWSYVQ